MKIIHTPEEWKKIRSGIASDKKIGFVPTMGGLHNGHLSLVQKCRNENDISVVSVYLNPTQFNDKNDLLTYPANFEDDSALLEKAGVDYLFAPDYSAMYPDGYTYSDETIERFAKMKTAAPDFKIFWDEAYIVHHLTEEIIETPVLLNVSKKYGTQDRVFMFTSTSKITFPGAGVSAIACSDNSMKYMCKRFAVMIISYDKMNQLRHVRFLKNKEGVLAHMAKHRRRLVPCFDAVKTAFAANLTPCGDIAHWTNPKGGYFISLYVMPGCAKRVADLCKDAGLVLTGAGSAYPYHKDPQDSHLRIAPTYPSLDEVETASELLCVCVRLAVVEKLLADMA